MSYLVRLSPNVRRDRDRIVAYYDDPDRLQGDRFLDDFFTPVTFHKPHELIGIAYPATLPRDHASHSRA